MEEYDRIVLMNAEEKYSFLKPLEDKIAKKMNDKIDIIFDEMQNQVYNMQNQIYNIQNQVNTIQNQTDNIQKQMNIMQNQLNYIIGLLKPNTK